MLLQKEIIAKKNRITAYGRQGKYLICKSYFKEQGFCVDFCGCNITMFNLLMELVTKKECLLLYPYSIVILDGDIRMIVIRKINNADNILILPK